MRTIIKYVPDIITCTCDGRSALMYSCYSTSTSIEKINFLLDHGIDVNAGDNDNNTVLMSLKILHIYSFNLSCCESARLWSENNESACKHFEDAIELLIFRGVNISIKTIYDDAALNYVRVRDRFTLKSLGLLEDTIKISSAKRAT